MGMIDDFYPGTTSVYSLNMLLIVSVRKMTYLSRGWNTLFLPNTDIIDVFQAPVIKFAADLINWISCQGKWNMEKEGYKFEIAKLPKHNLNQVFPSKLN